VIIANDSASTHPTYTASYVQHKETRLSDLVKATSTFRVKNGSPVGIERSNNSIAGVTYSEDIVLEASDLVQIYAYASQANTARQAVITDFRICGTDDNTDLLHRVTVATI